MRYLVRDLVIGSVCVMAMINLSEAMYGLCSTNWFYSDLMFDFEKCLDNNEECKLQGGSCHYGVGDHNEGCVCLKEVFREDHWEYMTLTKDHFNGKGRMFKDIFPIKVNKVPPKKKP
ncbi:uncharacterized protein LOC132713594 [Ruditapes philippinarum]|uniref:uncharacterized protein LOC132713594 n=1 Tax=Ruditapes philippinarum TaxID=129788 RepID=UPI00295BA43A|nr:uncharacterized protein LOC132713594 [Ruditapes philippinarum]